MTPMPANKIVVNDVWPAEFGHISCYFIECPGLYTKRELMQWKPEP